MSRVIRGDAVELGFDPDDLEKEIKMEVAEAMEEVNKANAIIAEQQRLGNLPRPTFPTRRPGNTLNQFNIVGGTIGQAVIGGTGPVVVNQEKKVFYKGAHDTNYKITGGNFSQANVGGTAEYNNSKGTSISAGGGKGVGTGGTGISAEDVTITVLEKGIATEDLIKLLDDGYSLSSLAFSVPEDPQKRNRFVRALVTG